MFPTKDMLALFQPTEPVPAHTVQFAPGKIMRTDGLPVDETLDAVAEMFHATSTDVETESHVESQDVAAQYAQRRQLHGLFHRTASISDLTDSLYNRFAHNPNSMAHWLPAVVAANSANTTNDNSTSNSAAHAPFLIPETTIWRLPHELAQYLRIEYPNTTPASRALFNEIISDVFDLKPDTTYFIKTGTFSCKFEFANAKCSEPDEMGGYFQVISNIAMSLGAGECIDLVVREYIEDAENNPTIYHGMPLRTEYRAFVDLDYCEPGSTNPAPRVLGITPYWHPSVMEKALALASSDVGADFGHINDDYHTYLEHKHDLMDKFHVHRDDVLDRLSALLPQLHKQGLRGQWSIDIMKNGDNFYLIDMALMCESALTEVLAVTEEYATVEPSVINSFDQELYIDYDQHTVTFDQDYPSGLFTTRSKNSIDQ